jgi:hypothetical protein
MALSQCITSLHAHCGQCRLYVLRVELRKGQLRAEPVTTGLGQMPFAYRDPGQKQLISLRLRCAGLYHCTACGALCAGLYHCTSCFLLSIYHLSELLCQPAVLPPSSVVELPASCQWRYCQLVTSSLATWHSTLPLDCHFPLVAGHASLNWLSHSTCSEPQALVPSSKTEGPLSVVISTAPTTWRCEAPGL